MIGAMTEITAEIELLSPMRIGTGTTGRSDGLKVPDEETGKDRPVEIGLVAAGDDGCPVIPGSSLKGVARALMADDPAVERLFGPLDAGKAGRLTFWTGRLMSADVAGLAAAPYADAPRAADPDRPAPGGNLKHAELGLFVEARTAIGREWGVAEAGLLFHQQHVPAGAVFKVELALAGADGGDIAAVGTLLARMAGGFRIGAGTTAGQGRAKLRRKGLTAAYHGLTDDDSRGDIIEDLRAAMDRAATRPLEAARSLSLTLKGDGPFLVNDQSKTKARKAAGEDSRDPHLAPLAGFGGDADKPRLPGPSLIGALRARALWLGRLDAPCYEDLAREVFQADDIAELTEIERLFGVNGWRGLLHVRSVTCENEPARADMTSVRLDRMSGAPIDSGLFTTRAYVDPVFRVELAVEQRGKFPKEDDIEFFDRLVKDIEVNGLCLGHGASRGYGWFDVEVEDG